MAALTASKAEVIQQLLIDAALGVVYSSVTSNQPTDWRVHVAREPDMPDNAITIYDTAGRIHGRFQATGEVQEHNGVQIRVRSADYDAGNRKIQAIADYLDETLYQATVTVLDSSGTNAQAFSLHSASRVGSVNYLGIDEENQSRYLFTVNYTLAF